MEGLWGLSAKNPDNELVGAGVLFVEGEKLWGGDIGFFWTGTLERKEGGVLGKLTVRRFIKGAKSLFPQVNHLDQYDIEVSGGYDPARFWATVSVVGMPSVTATMELRRLA